MAGAAATVVAAKLSADASSNAAGAVSGGGGLSRKFQRRTLRESQKRIKPFQQAGVRALGLQEQFLGLRGAEQQAEAFADFQESPGQKFLRERQEQTLIRNQTALGGLGGANIRTALQEQGAGIASTQLGNFQDRLAGLSGQGLNAATTMGQLGSATATGVGSSFQQGGQATASGILGKSEAIQGGIRDLAQNVGFFNGGSTNIGPPPGGARQPGGGGFFSDERLKTNIIKIDELESGLNWYCWNWIESAKEFVGDQPQSGVIAQEAQKLFPEAIDYKFGYLTVDYRRIH